MIKNKQRLQYLQKRLNDLPFEECKNSSIFISNVIENNPEDMLLIDGIQLFIRIQKELTSITDRVDMSTEQELLLDALETEILGQILFAQMAKGQLTFVDEKNQKKLNRIKFWDQLFSKSDKENAK